MPFPGETTIGTVQRVLSEQLGIDPAAATPPKSLIVDLGADSLDTVELILAFEAEYDIVVQDEEAEKILTVADLIKAIDEKLAD